MGQNPVKWDRGESQNLRSQTESFRTSEIWKVGMCMGILIPDPELLGGLAGNARPLPGVLCLPCKLQPNGMSGCGSDVGGSELVSQRLA